MNTVELYLAGLNLPDGEYSASIEAALIGTQDARYLWFAGRYWHPARKNNILWGNGPKAFRVSGIGAQPDTFILKP